MKKSEKKLPEHYDSLDAPIFIWNKIHEAGDLTWLLIKRKALSIDLLPQLQKIWETIYDEYLKEFGFSDSFLSIKMKEKEIMDLKIEFMITKDRTLLTWIEISENELQDLKKGISTANIVEAKIAIQRYNGYQLNMRETSIREFYYLIKQLK